MDGLYYVQNYNLASYITESWEWEKWLCKQPDSPAVSLHLVRSWNTVSFQQSWNNINLTVQVLLAYIVEEVGLRVFNLGWLDVQNHMYNCLPHSWCAGHSLDQDMHSSSQVYPLKYQSKIDIWHAEFTIALLTCMYTSLVAVYGCSNVMGYFCLCTFHKINPRYYVSSNELDIHLIW